MKVIEHNNRPLVRLRCPSFETERYAQLKAARQESEALIVELRGAHDAAVRATNGDAQAYTQNVERAVGRAALTVLRSGIRENVQYHARNGVAPGLLLTGSVSLLWVLTRALASTPWLRTAMTTLMSERVVDEDGAAAGLARAPKLLGQGWSLP